MILLITDGEDNEDFICTAGSMRPVKPLEKASKSLFSAWGIRRAVPFPHPMEREDSSKMTKGELILSKPG